MVFFGSGRYFIRGLLFLGGAGGERVGLGDVYRNLGVRLRFGCCIAKPRDD